MKRELFAIGSQSGYAIRVLNSIFCRKPDCEESKDWTEEEKEMHPDNVWLIAEQINSMCSSTMLMDARDVMTQVMSLPSKRLCEELDCQYHHPENAEKESFNGKYEKFCSRCIHNKHILNAKAVRTDQDNYKKK